MVHESFWNSRCCGRSPRTRFLDDPTTSLRLDDSRKAFFANPPARWNILAVKYTALVSVNASKEPGPMILKHQSASQHIRGGVQKTPSRLHHHVIDLVPLTAAIPNLAWIPNSRIAQSPGHVLRDPSKHRIVIALYLELCCVY
jgi:hypothetical protein